MLYETRVKKPLKLLGNLFDNLSRQQMDKVGGGNKMKLQYLCKYMPGI